MKEELDVEVAEAEHGRSRSQDPGKQRETSMSGESFLRKAKKNSKFL